MYPFATHRVSIFILSAFFFQCHARILIDPVSCHEWFDDVTQSINSVLHWADIAFAGLIDDNAPHAFVIQSAATLIINDGSDAAHRLSAIAHMGPIVSEFTGNPLPSDVIIYCDLARFQPMNAEPNKVVDRLNNIHMPLEQYQRGMDQLDPAVEGFCLRAPNRIDQITLAPWFLNSLIGETDEDDDRIHLTEEDVHDSVQYPGGDVNKPDIDALRTLETTLLHELTHTTFAFISDDNNGYGWKNMRNNPSSTGADNLAYIGQIAFMISQYGVTVNPDGQLIPNPFG